MSRIQPFGFQYCTAFRERNQLANKVNEIIDILNSSDSVESLSNRVTALENEFAEYVQAFTEEFENIRLQMQAYYHELYAETQKYSDPTWIPVSNASVYNTLFNRTTKKALKNIHIMLKWNDDRYEFNLKNGSNYGDMSFVSTGYDENDIFYIDYVKMMLNADNVVVGGRRFVPSTGNVTELVDAILPFVANPTLQTEGNSVFIEYCE